MMRVIALQAALGLLCVGVVAGQMNEQDRLAEYHARNYSWPLPQVNPNTPGWDKLMRRRLAQVERVQNDDDRYNGWVSVISAAVVAPNFTELGWGLTRV
jgi:hypothetical protein